MLTNAQEKLIRSLHTKKGRDASGLCLVEGSKVIETAGTAVTFTFSIADTKNFKKLVTTQTPDEQAGVAKTPSWTHDDIRSRNTIVVLDGVQDPGNVGAILRLCLGFNASLISVDCADITSPKVVRASVGAMFLAPWIEVQRAVATDLIQEFERPVYRMELGGVDVHTPKDKPCIIIAGSEGHGITLKLPGTSITIPHDPKLESLNVGHALAIVLAQRYVK